MAGAIAVTLVFVVVVLVGCGEPDAPTAEKDGANWPPADMHSTPEKAMTAYFQAMERGDADTVLKVTSPEIKELWQNIPGGRENAETQLRNSIGGVLKGMKVTWRMKDDWEISEDRAVATIELEVAMPGVDEPRIQEKNFSCTRVAGRWYCGNQW